jgi:hypothetical protein
MNPWTLKKLKLLSIAGIFVGSDSLVEEVGKIPVSLVDIFELVGSGNDADSDFGLLPCGCMVWAS